MEKIIPRFKRIEHESVMSMSATAYPPGSLIIRLNNGWVKAGTYGIDTITVPEDFDGDFSAMVEFRQELKELNDRRRADHKRIHGW